MSRRRKNKNTEIRQTSLKLMKCFVGGCLTETLVDKDCVAVICHRCVQKRTGVDQRVLDSLKIKFIKSKPTGFPKGYHLYKQYVHSDGRVFEYGKENLKLKNKLVPTVVKHTELTRSQRRRIREEKQLRRDARLAKQYKKKEKEKQRRQRENNGD